MGSNTLTPVSSPVSTDDIDQYRIALLGDFLPRKASSGAPEGSQHSLGTAAINWKNLYTANLYIGGVLFDPTGTGGEVNTSNAIISGATRATSEQPDFLRASGAAATVTILATTTPLAYTANGASATISADTAITSLTTAPATNNTCLINDINLADQESTKFLGEEGTTIPVDTMGSELTSRVGQYVCLKTANNEYILAFIKSITELTMCYRGYFIDSTGAPVFRNTLANNDTLTLMSLGWIFADSDGTTIDVSYRSPLYEDTEPASGTTDDYWFDTSGQQWYRYSGAAWVQVDRMLIGSAVIDTTNCVASRSFDITQGYFDHNTVEVELFSTTQVYSKQGRSQLSVYGNTHYFNGGAIIWDIANDLESPLSEAADTFYYLYITETGEHKISDKRPHDRRSDLKGWYHPHNTWVCIGVSYNDGSSNLVNAVNFKKEDAFLTGSLLSSTQDWDIITIPGNYETSGTAYINSPLYDNDTTGFLIVRGVTSSTSVIQEWYEVNTGDKWSRSYDGTNWTMWIVREENPANVIQQFSDCIDYDVLDPMLKSFSSGTGSQLLSYIANSEVHKGVYQLETGTTSLGYVTLEFKNSAGRLDASNQFVRLESKYSIPVLSDGSQGFTTMLGFIPASLNNMNRTANDIIVFSQEDSENGGNWTCVTDSGGTETATDSGVAPTAGVDQKARIEINNGGTEVKFFIDDALVATHTTNIFTVGILVHGMLIRKTSGSTERDLFIDKIISQRGRG